MCWPDTEPEKGKAASCNAVGTVAFSCQKSLLEFSPVLLVFLGFSSRFIGFDGREDNVSPKIK